MDQTVFHIDIDAVIKWEAHAFQREFVGFFVKLGDVLDSLDDMKVFEDWLNAIFISLFGVHRRLIDDDGFAKVLIWDFFFSFGHIFEELHEHLLKGDIEVGEPPNARTVFRDNGFLQPFSVDEVVEIVLYSYFLFHCFLFSSYGVVFNGIASYFLFKKYLFKAHYAILVVMNKFLVEASPLKRIASYFIDLILVIAVGFVLFATLGQNVIAKALGANEASKNANDFAVSSGLTYYPDGKDVPEIYRYEAKDSEGNEGYQKYFDKVWYYYTDFLDVAEKPVTDINDKIEVKKHPNGENFSSEDYLHYFFEEILGFTRDTAGDNKYFTYHRDGESIVYTEMPRLNETYRAKVEAGDESALSELLAYFFHENSNGSTGVYVEAIKDLRSEPYYMNEANRYAYAIWATEVITILPMVLALFFLIPLCLKDGRSLGKLFMGVEVVDIRGFRISTFQKIVRPIIVTLLHFLPFIPNVYLGMALYLFFAVASFLMMSIGKKRLNLHERITKTVVVDSKRSTVFSDEHEKSLYMEEYNVDENGTPLMKFSEGEVRVNLTKEE